MWVGQWLPKPLQFNFPLYDARFAESSQPFMAGCAGHTWACAQAGMKPGLWLWPQVNPSQSRQIKVNQTDTISFQIHSEPRSHNRLVAQVPKPTVTHIGRIHACFGARLCEPQRAVRRMTCKLVPASVLLATRCGSQTRAPAETGDVRALIDEPPFPFLFFLPNCFLMI